MRSDPELLRGAARVLDRVFGQSIEGRHVAPKGDSGLLCANDLYWCPLTDEGDALRLADLLHISIHYCPKVVVARVNEVTKGVQEPHGPKSVCRAVVRAAIELVPMTYKSKVRWHTEVKPTVASKTRRIVAAALLADDGDVLVGIRHYSSDMREQIKARPDGHKFSHLRDRDQGFVDQQGLFLTRKAAWLVAEAAGQIVNPDAGRKMSDGSHLLHSECLY